MHKSSSIEVTHQTHLVNFRYLAKNCLHKHFDFVHISKTKKWLKKQFRILFYLKDNSQVYATNNLNNNRDVVQIMGAVFL